MKRLITVLIIMCVTMGNAQTPFPTGIRIGNLTEVSSADSIPIIGKNGVIKSWIKADSLKTKPIASNLQQVTDKGYVTTNPIETSSYFQGGQKFLEPLNKEYEDILKSSDGNTLLRINTSTYSAYEEDYLPTTSIFVGKNTGINASSYNSNAFGSYALMNNVGSDTNAFGSSALMDNKGAASNGFGHEALSKNRGPASNGFGYGSLSNNMGGNVNGFGHNALFANLGNQSNGFGYRALVNNKSDFSNGFGHEALSKNRGRYASGFGYRALLQNSGEMVIGLGSNVLRYNNRDKNTAIGHDSFSGFYEDTVNKKDFLPSDIDAATRLITITGHGFVPATGNEHINLKYTTTGTPISGLVNGDVSQYQITSSNTISAGIKISNTGSGVHSFTPQINYTNSTTIGANSHPTASNQVTLGDENVTQVDTYGAIRSRAYGSGVSTGTATYNLATDAAGNLIEIPLSSGGGGAGNLQETTDLGYVTTNPIETSSYLQAGQLVTVPEKNEHQVLLKSSNGQSVLRRQISYWDGTVFKPSQSWFLGENAGSGNVGQTASGFGLGALSNNSGNSSSGFGLNALGNNTGNNSNGFGSGALINNTGNSSSGFGSGALASNKGDNSNGFGWGALNNNTGIRANGFGYSALEQNTGIDSNGFGFYALGYNTGSNSNAFGNSALAYNTGSLSNAFGNSAMNRNTGGRSNGFGESALMYNSGAFSNGFGAYALRNNTGSYSNGFGDEALRNNTGVGSSGFGRYALRDNTAGNANAFGNEALQYNTGDRSNGFGESALKYNTQSNSNGFGHSSLTENTGESSNGFGNQTLHFNEGANNTALGHYSFGGFYRDNSKKQNFLPADVNTTLNRVTIASHGFGAIGDVVKLVFSTTGSPVLPYTEGSIDRFKIIDANTIEQYIPGTGTIKTIGSGTHSFTPQIQYTNTTTLGANTRPTKSNQVVLGDNQVTEVVMGNGSILSPFETTNTGTTISLTSSGGNLCNMGSANANTIYLTTGTVLYAKAIVFINTATEPTITGGRKISGDTWTASTNMYMEVTYMGSARGVEYKFIKI